MNRSKPENISVLLIEDDDAEAFLISRMLTHSLVQSFEVEHAPRLKTGTQMLASDDFDVCLLDLGLPDGTGIDSLHQIRSVDARLPIVVLTGNDDENLGLTAIETGAQDFVAKNALSGQLLTRSLRFAIARQQKMLGHASDANTDTLTGMPNRRKLDDSFLELTAKCDQLCIALLDVDHFKNINDTHGHLIGDEVLKHLAAVITENKSDEIQAARYGGEEFAILMPESDLDTAFDVIDNLLITIAESTLESESRIKITASAGVSDVRPGESFEDTLRRTDVALYDAKQSGRNRVCVGK